MVQNASLNIIDPSQQSFVPGAFGGAAQVVLNTTAFDDIISQLNNVAQTFDAQVAGQNSAPISLVSTGCYANATSEDAYGSAAGEGLRDGAGYRDCAAACASPATMFNSSYTFWNCLTLGAASQYVQDQGLAVDSGDVAAVGADMGFATLAQFNATQIFDDTLSCIRGSCQDYSLGACSDEIAQLNITGLSNQATALFVGLENYCSGMDDVVDSDIAGPGVSCAQP